MAPILRGLLTPFASRGQGLYYFWEQQFGWQGKRLSDSMPPNLMARRPLALFNAADVDSGRRIVLGYPPVPEWLLPDEIAQSEAGQELNIKTRENEYAPLAATASHSSRLAEATLTRAVRLSASFPFGFRVAEFERDIPYQRNESSEELKGPLHILDGGVIDNTGIDSLHAVFAALNRRARHNPLGEAAAILQEIRRRGVVFVEIDSGAKPSQSNSQYSPFSWFSRPLSALNNAVYTNSIRSSDSLIRTLRSLLAHWIPSGLLLCNDGNVGFDVATAKNIWPGRRCRRLFRH